jgi:hypothetical protein
MFKVIFVLLFNLAGFGTVVAIPGEQPILAFVLGFVLTLAGIAIGDEMDGHWKRWKRK